MSNRNDKDVIDPTKKKGHKQHHIKDSADIKANDASRWMFDKAEPEKDYGDEWNCDVHHKTDEDHGMLDSVKETLTSAKDKVTEKVHDAYEVVAGNSNEEQKKKKGRFTD